MTHPTQTVSRTVSEENSFDRYLSDYKSTLRHVFANRGDIERLSLNRGMPPYMMREIFSRNPLAAFVPTEYGGRGIKPYECQAVLAASSYESLALSLTVGINGALFLQPVAKYGVEEKRRHVFRRVLQDKHMGGLMITEPGHGSDALGMQTRYRSLEGGGYHIKGLKHWAGLTGWADFWLLTARRADADGQLSRDIDFFICDVNDPDQHIEVEEVFENLGLYMIPYGRNRIDVRVPESSRLQPKSTGIKMMLDLLHRSRTQFPGMGMGFLQRILDEAIEHCRSREVGGSPLTSYDQVQARLAKLQASYTICSAMCTYTSEHAGLEHDMSKDAVSANAIKSVVTDLMHDASQSLLQLVGAKGYRLDHVAGRSLVDSRPFQIFEGSNDILYQQISEGVLKFMRKAREKNLLSYLKSYKLTERVADMFKDSLNVNVDLQLSQRKLVDLGRAIGRMVSMDFVVELGERGFRSDLVSNALETMRRDVEMLMTNYRFAADTAVVEDYEAESGWLDYVRK